MANECTVFEMQPPRIANAALRSVPFLAVTQISAGGTVTLNKSTTMVSVYSTLAGGVTFSSTANANPSGTAAERFPIAASGTPADFDVRPGTKIRFD